MDRRRRWSPRARCISTRARRGRSLNGKSLLPAGVTRIEGGFARGDCILIRDAKGGEIGRGLVTYDASDAAQIIGRSTKDIEGILGFKGPDEIIHRDDMALGGE